MTTEWLYITIYRFWVNYSLVNKKRFGIFVGAIHESSEKLPEKLALYLRNHGQMTSQGFPLLKLGEAPP